MNLRRIAPAVLCLTLVAGSASAFIDPTVFARLALLAKIASTLHDVYLTLRKANESVQSVRNRLWRMFPSETLAEIRSVFQGVRSIQDEITTLSCGWRFSPRTERMRLGLLRLGPLCRGEYQALFGAPLPGLDQDLDEYRQWQGVIRLNQVRDAIAASRNWTESADWLGKEARAGGPVSDPNNPASVGYSMRLLAEAEAIQLQVAARTNALEAMRLAGLQEDLDGERHEDWLEKNASAAALRLVQDLGATSDPGPRP